MMRVYRFGLPVVGTRRPENEESIWEQMNLSRRYYNKLNEIEIWRRNKTRAYLLSIPEIRAAYEAFVAEDAACKVLSQGIEAARAAARSRKAPKALLDGLADRKRTRREAQDLHWSLCRKHFADQAVKDISAKATADGKLERKNNGLYSGTYLLVEDAARAAHKDVPLWRGVEPANPRFKSRDGEGMIGVEIQRKWLAREDEADVPIWASKEQLEAGDAPMKSMPSWTRVMKAEGKEGPRQVRLTGKVKGWVEEASLAYGMRVEELFEEHARIRIDPVDPGAWYADRWCDRNRLSRTVLHMCVKMDEKNKPIWGSWPMMMHRQIPPGSLIKKASVSCRLHGPRKEWAVMITADVPECYRVGHGKGLVGMDIGWRVIGDEMRVLAWQGEDGEKGELRLPADLVSGLRHPQELRRRRDLEFNAALAGLVIWLREHTMPDWMKSRTVKRTMEGKLGALVREWGENRFDGDEKIYVGLETALAGLNLWLQDNRMPDWMKPRMVRKPETEQATPQEREEASAWKSHGKLGVLMHEWKGHRFQGDEQIYASIETALAGLTLWLRNHELPTWMATVTETLPTTPQALAYLAAWKSHGKLGSLVREWKKNRFEGDEQIYDAMEKWRYHDYHLWQWETSSWTAALRKRRDLYRVFAKKMAEHYQSAVIEEFDLRRVARKPEVEKKEGDNPYARSNRQLASVSELRDAVVLAFTSRNGWATVNKKKVDSRIAKEIDDEGCESENGAFRVDEEAQDESKTSESTGVQKTPAAWTTQFCNVCHQLEKFDAAAELVHTCSHCNHTWDQDENAAINILQRGLEQQRDGSAEKAARQALQEERAKAKSGGKFARKRRERAAAENGNGNGNGPTEEAVGEAIENGDSDVGDDDGNIED